MTQEHDDLGGVGPLIGRKPRILKFHQRPKRVIIECACGFGHFVVFDCEPLGIGEGEEWEVFLVEEWRTTRGLVRRLRAMLRLFFKGDAHTADVLLGRDDVERVRAWCDEVLSSTEDSDG